MKSYALAVAFAAAMFFSFSPTAYAEGIHEGKIESTKKEGRVIMIGGKEIRISGSRTEVKIGGKEDERENIKVGMMCKAVAADRKGKYEAKTVSCKK